MPIWAQDEGPPQTRAIPAGPLPAPLIDQQAQVYYDEVKEKKEFKATKEPETIPELVYPGISEYPAIAACLCFWLKFTSQEARPPQVTAFEVSRK